MPYGSISVDQINNTTGYSLGAGNATAMKNRLINGAMVIDQRNSGSSLTPTSNGQYTIDRWNVGLSQSSKFTIQQNAGSITPPVGFTNYAGLTVASATSVGSGDYFRLGQIIEGYNVADLGWGTANAKTVTLSFWVYSSLTGTYGGALGNGASNRSYPFTYSISQANTWTQISVTIPGDTTGTWYTNNGIGITVNFGLGIGSTYTATAGSWATGLYVSANGSTNWIGTTGATFYITGVQLEVGSVATGYEYRHYGLELMLCQRYFWKKVGQYSSGNTMIGAGMMYNSTDPRCCLANPVPMRVTPAITFSGSGFTFERAGTFTGSIPNPVSANLSPEASLLYSGAGASSQTAGQGTFWYLADNTTSISVSAEL